MVMGRDELALVQAEVGSLGTIFVEGISPGDALGSIVGEMTGRGLSGGPGRGLAYGRRTAGADFVEGDSCRMVLEGA